VPLTHVLAGNWTDAAHVTLLAHVLSHHVAKGRGQLLLIDAGAGAGAGTLTPLQAALAAVYAVQTARSEDGAVAAPASLGRDAARWLLALASPGDVPTLDPATRSGALLAAAAAGLTPAAAASWRVRQAAWYAALLAGNGPALSPDGGSSTGLGADVLPALVTNGRVLAPVPSGWDTGDTDLWERFELAVRARPLLPLVTRLQLPLVPAEALTAELYGTLLASIVSVVGPTMRDRISLPLPSPTQPDAVPVSLELPAGGADAATARVHVTMLVDPLTEEAQRQAALALLLRELPGVRVVVRLQPAPDTDELVVRRYYRIALPARPTFNAAGQRVPTAVMFHGLPADLLLTLGLEVPQAWLVECTAAVYDLDNLVLSTAAAAPTVQAGFQLKRLLVEGHASEAGSGWPPRGLQLVLGSPARPHVADTLVMANLGYFQLQATPGLWTLRIQAGRSAKLYGFAPTAASDAAVGAVPEGAELVRPVVVATLRGALVRPQFVKRPGRENDQLLREGGGGSSSDRTKDDGDDDDDDGKGASGAVAERAGGSMWDSMKSAYVSPCLSPVYPSRTLTAAWSCVRGPGSAAGAQRRTRPTPRCMCFRLRLATYMSASCAS
jgi:hypothetical protein